MSDFTEIYKSLLILQYADKPKARADIETRAVEWEGIYNFARSFETEFDIDTAWGDRLDKIGKIVGQTRIIERGYLKTYFGFLGNPNARGFGVAPFFKLTDPVYEKTVLSDEQYRFFIRARISKNVASARLSSESGSQGLQETIDFLFSSEGFAVDNKDMTMTIYLDESYDPDRVAMVINEDLIPTPQGVDIKNYILTSAAGNFGFSNNPQSKGFGQGPFARLVII
jgi:hypothetical protein